MSKKLEQGAACETIRFYVSLEGDDRWSGRLAAPNARRKDGPFASIARAQRAVRALRRRGEMEAPVRVELRGGVYELSKPLVFTPADSGSPPRMGEWNTVAGPERGVTYAAYPGERPVLSGGRRIGGWKPTQVHGRSAWVTTLPAVKRGQWYFTQLWVNGRRADRTRSDRKKLFQIEQLLGEVYWEGDVNKMLFTGQDQFRFRAGDLAAWRNVRDIEFVGLHYWIDSRINFAAIDPASRTARLQWKSKMRLSDDFAKAGAPYYVENVFEWLTQPGQWYLDRPSGKLYYLPRPGEKIGQAEIYAPRLQQLAFIQGEADKPVEHLHFEGLSFAHSEWTPDVASRKATPQAACHVPGAVVYRRAARCRMERCGVAHVSTYGIEVTDASTDVAISHCRITDLGGGGVKVWHNAAPRAKTGYGAGPDQMGADTCRRITIADCQIADGGHRHHQAVGVLIGKCSGNQVLHNHIHDFDYTGISVGWTWGYAEGLAYGNIIEHNHVHDIGRGVLSDLGGIYTLGVQPGTRIRFNVFHDITSRGYGSWGIYTDEGSSDILIESNLVYRTKSQGFHQHYGRDNIVRNNIFAFGQMAQVALSRQEPHRNFTFTSNIVYFDSDGKVLAGKWANGLAVLDRNLYFNRSGKPLDFSGMTLKQWQARGHDRQSIIGDPLFANPDKDDYRLKPGSPAAKIGFVPVDFSTVGPRGRPGPR